MLVCPKSVGSQSGVSQELVRRLQQTPANFGELMGSFLESSLFSSKHIGKKQKCRKERRHGDDRKTRMHWKDMKVYIRKDRKLLESFWRAFGELLESLGDSLWRSW